MDNDGDVERLFSWLQTPDLRYREFAGEREVSDATATWPALRKAASAAAPAMPAPGGERTPATPVSPPAPPPPADTAEAPPARGTLAARLREAMGRLPPLAEDRSRFTDLGGASESEPPPQPRPEHRFGAPLEPRPGGDAPAPRAPDLSAGPPDRPPPVRRPTLSAVPTSPPASPSPPRASAEEEGASFGDVYRGFEDAPGEPPEAPPADPSGHPRSLDAVFSRVARPSRPPPREGRGRAGQSGLGPVFRRLR